MAASAVSNGATARTTRSEAADNSLDASRQNGLNGHDHNDDEDYGVVKRDQELSDGPAANWEVAYVYSYLHTFTDLIDPSEDAFPSVMAFEDALLSCSPRPTAESSAAPLPKPLSSLPAPNAKDKREAEAAGKRNVAAGKRDGKQRAGSPASSLSSLDSSDDGATGGEWIDPFESHSASAPVLRASVEPLDPIPPPRAMLADGETFDVPPHSELIKTVMLELNKSLSELKELTDYHGKKTWFHFLINFVTQRLQSDLYSGGFRWRSNLLRTRGLKPGQEDERNFWLLRWEDKVHLMRQMIDYMLVSVPSVRDKIKDAYDLGNQRIAKRDPESNPLVILPLGRTSSLLTIYQLDTSPRLYASGAPYKPSAPWVAVSSTIGGYKAFIESLSAPTKADRKKIALKGPFAKAVGAGVGGWGGEGKVGGAKKAKAKEADEREQKEEEERVLRARLEERLEEVEKWEEEQQVLRDRAARAAERAATRDARIARNISRLGAGTTTRSSRLRTRADVGEGSVGPNYNEDDDVEDDGMGVGRRKRRKVEDDAFSYGEGEDETPGAGGDDAESVASGSRRGGRRGAASTLPPAIPGERSSRRLAGVSAEVTPAAEDAEEEGEDLEANGAAPATAEEEEKAVVVIGAGGSALQAETNGAVEEEKDAKPMDVDVAPAAAPAGIEGEVEAKPAPEETGAVVAA
ncbi:hypothetical protein JCM11251_002027 [Rhodosporidiobolus azoricus]